jgi:hypothetical protein
MTRGRKKIKNKKKSHMEVTRGDSVPCCEANGYHRESSICKGKSKKNKNTRGITKHPYFVGGKSYLTLNN